MGSVCKRSMLLRTFNESLHNQHRDGTKAIKKAIALTAKDAGVLIKPEDVPDDCCQKIVHVSHDTIKRNDYVVSVLTRVGVPVCL